MCEEGWEVSVLFLLGSGYCFNLVGDFKIHEKNPVALIGRKLINGILTYWQILCHFAERTDQLSLLLI